jgi:hypothetical protein
LFAIVLMVMVPVFGSGGIRGSVAGKLLGLSTPLTFLAILAGSLIGCFGIALGSDVILSWLCANGALPAGIGSRVCGPWSQESVVRGWYRPSPAGLKSGALISSSARTMPTATFLPLNPVKNNRSVNVSSSNGLNKTNSDYSTGWWWMQYSPAKYWW